MDGKGDAGPLVEMLIELDRSTSKRIAVVGDGMTDVYVYGRMGQCQEGCPKFVQVEEHRVPGGAENAARSLCRWNASVMEVVGVLPRSTKTRFMVDGKCVFRHDDDVCNSDSESTREDAIRRIKMWGPDAVLISDYDKGFLTPSLIKRVIEYCNTKYIPVVADAKRGPDLYRGAIIKGNREYWGHRPTLAGQRTVMTCGSFGPMVLERLYSDSRLPTVPCINHVGAGDCFAAHLTLALAHKLSLEHAAAVAHSAGRVYVQRHHNTPPDPMEILDDACGRAGKLNYARGGPSLAYLANDNQPGRKNS